MTDPLMNEPWKSLRAGDRVRIVRMPDWSSAPGHSLLQETIALYRLLVRKRAVLTIDNIDEYEKPWTTYFYVAENSSGNGYQILPMPDDTGDTEERADREYHTLAMDDDCWERVGTE